MEISMLRKCARLSFITLAVVAIGIPLLAVAWVAVALMGYWAVPHMLQNAGSATLGKRDQLILLAVKATLLLAALIIFSTIAIGAGWRSASRHLRRSRR
jgi:hypothetical protein